MMVSGVKDFLIEVKAASGTGLRALEEVLAAMPVPPLPLLLFCALVEEPLLVEEEVFSEEVPLLVVDVCNKVLLVLDPETELLCDELLSWLLADVVASVDVLEVVALTALVLLAESCELVAEDDEVPL